MALERIDPALCNCRCLTDCKTEAVESMPPLDVQTTLTPLNLEGR